MPPAKTTRNTKKFTRLRLVIYLRLLCVINHVCLLLMQQTPPAVGIAAGRVLRRWYRAKRLTKHITVQRVEPATGRIRYRRCRKRKQLLANNRGFVIVNDGPAMASQLARYLNALQQTSRVVGQFAVSRGDQLVWTVVPFARYRIVGIPASSAKRRCGRPHTEPSLMNARQTSAPRLTISALRRKPAARR